MIKWCIKVLLIILVLSPAIEWNAEFQFVLGLFHFQELASRNVAEVERVEEEDSPGVVGQKFVQAEVVEKAGLEAHGVEIWRLHAW